MSQSDYIQYKKTQQVLKDQTKWSAVLEPSNYTSWEKYAIETTVPNTKLRHSRLLPKNTVNVLEMERKISSCPTFTLCSGTNQRPNRVTNTISVPMPTYRLNKVNDPTKCTFQKNAYVQRSCLCSKKICKCGTSVCEDYTPT